MPTLRAMNNRSLRRPKTLRPQTNGGPRSICTEKPYRVCRIVHCYNKENRNSFSATLNISRDWNWNALIARGEWTLKDLETSKVAEANKSGSWLGRYLLNRKIADANDLGLELAAYGKSALERKDLPLAKRILPLALNLSNTTETRALNTQLQEALKAEARKEEETRILNEQPRIAEKKLAAPRTRAEQQTKEERPTVDGQEQKDTKRLMAEFTKACQEKRFVEAQQLMSQLGKQGVDTQEFRKLSKQLASDVATQVKNLTKIGVIHYRQQQYDEALNVWKQAQVLDPENEQLAARIKRVTRVTEKLQNLRTKGGATQ